ncbi:MAG: hypothetical protein HC861_02180 [Rhodospirillaceae bacterium]|nr:hypothetical protein [Rhodospirillaceae bacterium]
MIAEKTQHTLLVGDDATRFAAAQGFEETSLTNAASLKVWAEWAAKGERSNAWGPLGRRRQRTHGQRLSLSGTARAGHRGEDSLRAAAPELPPRLP